MMWLFACVGADAVSKVPVQGEGGVSDTRPALGRIAEAEDLDAGEGSAHFTLQTGLLDRVVDDITWVAKAYNGQIPGPTLRVSAGDDVVVSLENGLDETTTVHWHGLAVPNSMDGVSWISDPVPAGGSFEYAFTLGVPGTFWYHPHVNTNQQVDLGLYGAIVVEDPTEPTYDDELVLVFDAWGESADEDRTDRHGAFDPSSFPWTVNGLVDPVWTTDTGRSLRARLVNASNTSYLDIDWAGALTIAEDQGLLAASQSGRVFLAPGDRAEVVWAPTAGDTEITTRVYVPAGGASYLEDVRLLTLSVAEGGGVELAVPERERSRSEDLGRTDVRLVFTGGPSDDDRGWLINGESWPDVTPLEVSLGAEVMVEVRNMSASEHPFHLHGHAFEVLSVNGAAPAAVGMSDTVNVPIRGVARLRLLADNPGDWMAHCHLLGHENAGMMTIFRVLP